jgi:hypothetical protein
VLQVRRSILIGMLLLAAAALPASAGAEVSLQKVGDFSEPVQALGAPGDGERLYVVEQRGTIQVVEGGTAAPFADLTALVEHAGEQGLLSMAFAPDFQSSRKLYVYYTQEGGAANRVDELRAPTGDAVDLASRRLVLSIPHTTATNHNGGQIQFGPDGLLYAAPGDGGSNAANARDLGNLLGKVLRIDPNGTADGRYTVPPDNPFVAQAGARGEIWASGLRNPFRFSFDRLTGDLVLGDVGQTTTEEINFLPRSSGLGRGADFGWDVCEGSFVTGTKDQPCDLVGSVLPVLNKFQSTEEGVDNYQSIIPGFVVRDPSLPSLFGRLVYGDVYVAGLSSAQLGGTTATDDRKIGAQVEIAQLAGFGEDAGGCIYAASLTGPVYRLVENDARIPCAPTAPGATPVPMPGGTAADKRRPEIAARVKKRQRVLKLRGAVARVRCDEPCRVTAGGKLRIGKRRYALRAATTRRVRAAQLVRVKPRLTRRATRALRRALAAEKRPTVRLVLRARDVAGNQSRATRRTVLVKSR